MLQWLERKGNWQLPEQTRQFELTKEGISYQGNTRTAVERFCHVTRNFSYARRNPDLQWVGREELFERERASDPNWHYWNVCASASDQLVEAPPQ